MNRVTLSSKYQLVIPKELRRQLQLKPGQKLSMSLDKNKQNIRISTTDPLIELTKKFGGRDIWGEDPVKTIRKMRDEWDEN